MSLLLELAGWMDTNTLSAPLLCREGGELAKPKHGSDLLGHPGNFIGRSVLEIDAMSVNGGL